MGYDISCRGPHPEVEELDARLRELYPVQLVEMPTETDGITITRIDVAEPLDGEDHTAEFDRLSELQRASNAYFRVGYFHMPELIHAMVSIDALDQTPHPPWPAEFFEHEDVTAVRAYRGVTPLIPKDKLTSNDHWIITAEQAAASFAVCEGRVPRVMREPENTAYWRSWVDFLGHIAGHDGAVVS
jgi:hypothetical protein